MTNGKPDDVKTNLLPGQTVKQKYGGVIPSLQYLKEAYPTIGDFNGKFTDIHHDYHRTFVISREMEQEGEEKNPTIGIIWPGNGPYEFGTEENSELLLFFEGKPEIELVSTTMVQEKNKPEPQPIKKSVVRGLPFYEIAPGTKFTIEPGEHTCHYKCVYRPGEKVVEKPKKGDQ